jgi:hypothetical protein
LQHGTGLEKKLNKDKEVLGTKGGIAGRAILLTFTSHLLQYLKLPAHNSNEIYRLTTSILQHWHPIDSTVKHSPIFNV